MDRAICKINKGEKIIDFSIDGVVIEKPDGSIVVRDGNNNDKPQNRRARGGY